MAEQQLEKRRIIGISYKGEVHAGKVPSLWDTNIERIYYVTLNNEPFITSRKLDYTTTQEFQTESGSIDSPHSYMQSDLYVNCFLGRADVMGKNGILEKVTMPRSGLEVPIFNSDEKMLLVGTITGGSAFVYVSKEIGILEVDSHLLKVLMDPVQVKLLNIKSGQFKEFTPQLLNEISEVLSYKPGLTKKGQAKQQRLTPAETMKLCNQLKRVSVLEGLSAVQREEWVREAFIRLFEEANWTSHVVQTEIDTLYRKYTNNFQEPYTSSEVIEMARQILYFSIFPTFDEMGNEISGFYSIEDVPAFLTKYDALLDEIQESLANYFNTLVEQRKKDFLGSLGLKRTEMAVSEILGCSRTTGRVEGSEGQEGLSESVTAAQKTDMQSVKTGSLEGDEVRGICANNSENSAKETDPTTQLSTPADEIWYDTEADTQPADTQTQPTEAVTQDTRTPQEKLQELLNSAKKQTESIEEEREKQGIPKQIVKKEQTEELEDFNPVEEAKKRLNTGVIKSVQTTLADKVQSEIVLDAGECIPNCPLCGGKGYIQGPETLGIKIECKNHIKMMAERKAPAISKLEVDLRSTGLASVVTKNLIPKAYFDTTWSPDKAMDVIRGVAKSAGMECNTKEIQEYKKGLSVVLSYVVQGKLPEHSFMFSAPNNSGKATFAYTILKLLLAQAKTVVPYVTLMELAELRKRYLLWVGNLSDREYRINKSTIPDSYTSRLNIDDEATSVIQMTPQERDAYLKRVGEGVYRYTDFLDTHLLVCSMSQCTAQLPIEISTLKSILEYRARRCKPTIVMTDCLATSIDYSLYVGGMQEGLFTVITRNREFASYDRLLYTEIKPIRKKY